MRYFTLIHLWVIIFMCISCNTQPRDPKKYGVDKKAEELITINKYLVGKDADIIKSYIERRNWKMEVTETGLRYMIYKEGKGEKVKPGNKVTLKYVLSLLDGTECYSSEKDGLKSFVVGKGGVETGLEEGILLLHQGDKARFIMMPHLAHGLVGDGNRIPARAIIIYDVELIQITK